jgi:transposase
MNEGVKMGESLQNTTVLEPKNGTRSGTILGERTEHPVGRQVDPEVLEKPERRRFTAEYKLDILKKADLCTVPGQIGVLLRREGLYSSHLTTWRRQRDRGILDSLTPKKRGRKIEPVNPLSDRVRELERENEQLMRQLKQADVIIECQKKLCEILQIPMKAEKIGGSR